MGTLVLENVERATVGNYKPQQGVTTLWVRYKDRDEQGRKRRQTLEVRGIIDTKTPSLTPDDSGQLKVTTVTVQR